MGAKIDHVGKSFSAMVQDTVHPINVIKEVTRAVIRIAILCRHDYAFNSTK